MNKNHTLLFAIVFVLLAGCTPASTKDIRVDAQADPKANFSGYKSYAWAGSAAIINDPNGQWEPPAFNADAEIKFLIDRELRKRGMSESAGNPDLFVSFGAGIDMDALEFKIEPVTKIGTLTNVPKGALLVALIDSESGFVIWAGTATGDVQENPDAQTAKKRLDYAVTQLLKKLPK